MSFTLLSFGVVGMVYTPWLGYLHAQVSRVAADYWIPRTSWTDSASLAVQIVSLPLGVPLGDRYPSLSIALGTLATGILVWPWRRRWGEAHFGCILLAHALAIAIAQFCLGRSIFAPRYIIYLIPLALVAPADWLGRLEKGGCRTVATLGTLLLLGFFAFQAYVVRFGAPQNWARAADYLMEQCATDDAILCTDLGQYLDAQYYLRGSALSSRCWAYNASLPLAKAQHVNYSAGIPSAAIRKPAAFQLSDDGRVWIISGATPGLSTDEELPEGWSEIQHRTFGPASPPFEDAVPLGCYRHGTQERSKENP